MISFECLIVGRLRTNCYVVASRDHVAVIDPGDESERIIEAIMAKSANPLVSILLTHAHIDQIQAVPDIVNKFPSALIYASEAENLLLFDANVNLSKHCGNPLTFERISSNLRKVSMGETISIGECVLRVVEVPGHTPGSVIYICDTKHVVFCGDTILREAIGGTALPFGDKAKLSASINERILTLPDDTRLLPAHGELTTVGHEKEHNPFLILENLSHEKT
jgi:glyoxylase-like metal-dependent hydrolase (beta-lactamase superfamily II)